MNWLDYSLMDLRYQLLVVMYMKARLLHVLCACKMLWHRQTLNCFGGKHSTSFPSRHWNFSRTLGCHESRLWDGVGSHSPNLLGILMDSAVAAEFGRPSCVENRHLCPLLQIHKTTCVIHLVCATSFTLLDKIINASRL